TGRPSAADRHSQYALASSQLTPTTGRSGCVNAGHVQSRGASCPVALTNTSYSACVTGNTPSSKPSTKTRCGGRSSSCPRSVPIMNQPPAIGANADVIVEDCTSPIGRSYCCALCDQTSIELDLRSLRHLPGAPSRTLPV